MSVLVLSTFFGLVLSTLEIYTPTCQNHSHTDLYLLVSRVLYFPGGCEAENWLENPRTTSFLRVKLLRRGAFQPCMLSRTVLFE